MSTETVITPQQRRLVVAAVVVNAAGDVMLGRKAPGVPPYPDMWMVPGGGVEPGELCSAALHREIREETGIEITNLRPIRFDEDVGLRSNGEPVHYVFLDYLADYAGGEPKPDSDLAELNWFPRTELQGMADSRQIAAPTIRLMRLLGWIS